jgi:hypothetical protein
MKLYREKCFYKRDAFPLVRGIKAFPPPQRLFPSGLGKFQVDKPAKFPDTV